MFFLKTQSRTYFCAGGMSERFNEAVLKTVDCYRSGGSNPSPSAKQFLEPLLDKGFRVFNLLG